MIKKFKAIFGYECLNRQGCQNINCSLVILRTHNQCFLATIEHLFSLLQSVWLGTPHESIKRLTNILGCLECIFHCRWKGLLFICSNWSGAEVSVVSYGRDRSKIRSSLVSYSWRSVLSLFDRSSVNHISIPWKEVLMGLAFAAQSMQNTLSTQ